MSWVGKISALKKSFKSLFRKKEQALSTNLRPALPLSAQEMTELDALVQEWVDKKGYCLPDNTLSQAAARMGTQSALLYRYCQAQGMDFRTWRSWLRIQDAQEQMEKEPGTPASVIARRVGFKDRSNFTRQFKGITGKTPDEWRKSLTL